MFPLLMEGRRLAIDLTDCMDRSIKGRRVVIAFMIQPIARAMRLEIGFFLKSAPLSGARCLRQCHA